MGRRIVNRMEKRAEFEAFENRSRDEEEVEDEEEDEEDDEADDEEAEAAPEAGAESEEGVADEEEEVVPKKKKKVKVVKEPKPKAPRRARAPKAAPRMKVVWGVFDNSSRRIAVYDYPKKKEADDHAARLRSEKNQTYFVQPVKEPLDEKKE